MYKLAVYVGLILTECTATRHRFWANLCRPFVPLCLENRKNGLKINFKRGFGVGKGVGVLEGHGVGAASCDCAHPYRYRTAAYSNHQNWRHTAGRGAFSAAEAPKTQEALMAFKFLGQRQLGKLPSRWVSTILMVAISRYSPAYSHWLS